MKLKKINMLLFALIISCDSNKEQIGSVILEDNTTNNWKQEKYLIHPDSLYQIDLSNLNEVSKNLNGYWIKKNELNGSTILSLTYEDSIFSSFWTYLEFNEEVSKSGEVVLPSCQNIGELVLIDKGTHISFNGIGVKCTIKIEEMSNQRFTLDGETYLRHRGPFY